MDSYSSADEVRKAVARYLTDAAEVGTEFLSGDISHVMLFTHEGVFAAAALAAVEGEGDGFPAELAEIHAEAEAEGWSGDRLAFRVAMALYTR